MPLRYDFKKTTTAFSGLLAMNWAESEDRGWSRIIYDEDALKPYQGFLAYANQEWGYDFKKGTSPTLGDTLIVDPHRTQNYGMWGKPASAAFISAHGQVKAQHHCKKEAAQALAFNAYLQQLYSEAGVQDMFGHWSLGVNPRAFNCYRMSETGAETLFLKYMGDLVRRQAAAQDYFHKGNALSSDFSVGPGDTSQLKLTIRDGGQLDEFVRPLHESLVDMLGAARLHHQQDNATIEKNLKTRHQVALTKLNLVIW